MSSPIVIISSSSDEEDIEEPKVLYANEAKTSSLPVSSVCSRPIQCTYKLEAAFHVGPRGL